MFSRLINAFLEVYRAFHYVQDSIGLPDTDDAMIGKKIVFSNIPNQGSDQKRKSVSS